MYRLARVAAFSLAAFLSACGGGGGGGGAKPDTTVSAVQSTLSGSGTVVADGVAKVTVVATARNASGAPLSGKAAVFTTVGASLSASTVTTVADGTASVDVTSTAAGAKTISVVIDGVAVTASASVTFVAGAPASITFTTQPTTGTAGALGTVAVRVDDAHANPCPGASVSLALQGGPGGATLGGTTTGTTNSGGAVSFSTLSITKAGTGYQLAATATPASGTSNAFGRTAGAASPSGSTLAASPTSIPNDGSTTSTLTATVGDQYGNPIQGATVLLTSSGSPNLTQPAATTGASGQTTGSVKSLTAGTLNLSAYVNSTLVAQSNVTVTALPASASTSTVTLSLPSLQANNSTTSTVTVTVKDALSRAIIGATVALSYFGNTWTAPPDGTTDASGVATFLVKSSAVGSGTVRAKVNPGATEVVITQQPTLTFTTPYWTIGGTITGLRSNGLVLATAGQTDLSVGGGNTNFTFGTSVVTGTAYNVTIKTQPTGHACSLLNAFGSVYGNVTDITITCLRAWRQVAAGYSHTVAVTTDGKAYAWGSNLYGQIGTGAASTTPEVPHLLLPGVAVKSVAAGANQTFLCTESGSLYAMGDNSLGKLGVSVATPTFSPVQVSVPGTCSAASTNYAHSLALNTLGDLYAFGNNAHGEFGNGTTSTTASLPVKIKGSVAAMAAGDRFSVVVDTGGVAWTAGFNGNGRLGDGTTTNNSTFASVLTGVAAVAAGTGHVVALGTDGSVSAWGDDGKGQIGNGAATGDVKSPWGVFAYGQTAVAAGDAGSLSANASSLMGWGDNGARQLLDSATTSYPSYQAVGPGNAFGALGASHFALVHPSGGLLVRGDNSLGQLGDGTTTASTTWVLIDPP